MPTNVPSLTFTPTGVVLPAESAILAGVMADTNQAAGGGLSQTLTSPQGQIAMTQAAIIGDKNNEIAYIANMVDPDMSQGRWQDGIGRIYFLDRIAASGTVIVPNCIGLVGADLPAGSLVQDPNGYIYASLDDATFPVGGSMPVAFQCQTTGPIVCPLGALTIVKQVTGWDTCTLSVVGTAGTDVESRADFEFRRQNSVAANAVNSPQSIYAAVLSVPNVLDAYVIDNPTSSTVNTGSTNYPVVANSVYVAVVGGTAAQVAQAIWSKKSLGCNYNGTTTFVVSDTNYSVPQPQYTVKWVTPTPLPIYFSVDIVNNPAMVSNIVTLIKNAIVAAFNGADGGTRARIGAKLYAGRYYPGVSATDPNIEILSITMGTTSPGTLTSLIVGIDQTPTLNPANITVTLT